MSQLEENTTLIDWFKDRLASPFLFSYSLIVLAYNWQFIGWVLYHPMKFGDKIKNINGGYAPVELNLLYPFGLTLLILALSPIFNDIGTFFVKFSNRLFSSLLNSLEWDEYVKAKKFYNLEMEKQSLESDALTLKGENINLSKAAENSRSESEKLKVQVEDLEKSAAKQTNNYNELVKNYSELQSSYSQASSEINKLMEQLNSSKNKLLNQKFQTQLLLSQKILLLHYTSIEPLSTALSSEVKDKLRDHNIQAEFFIDNYDQIQSHPIYGIVIEGCFYKMGKMVLIPDDLDMKEEIQVNIILDGYHDDMEIYISYPGSEDKLLIDSKEFMVPKTADAFNFVEIECVVGKSRLVSEVLFNGEIANFKQPFFS